MDHGAHSMGQTERLSESDGDDSEEDGMYLKFLPINSSSTAICAEMWLEYVLIFFVQLAVIVMTDIIEHAFSIIICKTITLS